VYEEVKQGLKELFQTQADVLPLTATGTGAMEAAVTNLFSPGETVITVNGGKFGERWTKIAKAYGLNAVELFVERGDSVEPTAVEQALKANPAAKGLLFTASETATGALMPTQAIVELCKKAGVLSVCDAITACGVYDLPMDAWGIDVLITGSQKALMLPPGMAFIALSPRAWDAQAKAKLPRFYFDLAKERKGVTKNQTAWSPATSLILGARESLAMIREEGLQNCFRRHDRLARATRAAVEALGLERLAKKAPSPAVTAVKVPASISNGKLIPRTLRDRYGVTIAGGQDELEGKIFRLSHFGYCGIFDVTTALSALELTLKSLGHPVELGRGVGAALRSYSEGETLQ
jgi:aspartate aminotransferase-like enzyme